MFTLSKHQTIGLHNIDIHNLYQIISISFLKFLQPILESLRLIRQKLQTGTSMGKGQLGLWKLRNELGKFLVWLRFPKVWNYHYFWHSMVQTFRECSWKWICSGVSLKRGHLQDADSCINLPKYKNRQNMLMLEKLVILLSLVRNIGDLPNYTLLSFMTILN